MISKRGHRVLKSYMNRIGRLKAAAANLEWNLIESAAWCMFSEPKTEPEDSIPGTHSTAAAVEYTTVLVVKGCSDGTQAPDTERD